MDHLSDWRNHKNEGLYARRSQAIGLEVVTTSVRTTDEVKQRVRLYFAIACESDLVRVWRSLTDS